jgi:hypothetical protein
MAFSIETGGRGLVPPGLLPEDKEKTVKIEITQRCRVRGVDCQPGDIVETDKGTALDRIGMGRAKKYVPPPEPEKESFTEPLTEEPSETTYPVVAEPEGKKGKRGEKK